MRRMTASGEWRCAASAVAPGQSAKFRLQCGERAIDGFVVNHDGAYHAYVNRCPHVGTPLDLWPNEFHTEDRRALICSTHAAIYEPASGLCTAGPCAGDHLTRLPLRHEGAAVVVSCPAVIGGPRATRPAR
jgi:nitrite reductase/ring-hydroxylating ferredoxin subunit